jgi:hypothetical protein
MKTGKFHKGGHQPSGVGEFQQDRTMVMTDLIPQRQARNIAALLFIPVQLLL